MCSENASGARQSPAPLAFSGFLSCPTFSPNDKSVSIWLPNALNVAVANKGVAARHEAPGGHSLCRYVFLIGR